MIFPDFGFSCGNSMVQITGQNLDLAENKSVTIDGKESLILRYRVIHGFRIILLTLDLIVLWGGGVGFITYL